MSVPPAGPDLVKQTLRTVAVLVGACVLFVEALSIAAVAITSRALGSPSGAAGDVATPEPTKKNGDRQHTMTPAGVTSPAHSPEQAEKLAARMNPDAPLKHEIK